MLTRTVNSVELEAGTAFTIFQCESVQAADMEPNNREC